MPEFSSDSWTSFKEQFMSVIRFILYSFDLLFDSCRSHPMLYAFFFFPIFAAAFFVVFSVLVRLVHVPASSDIGSVGRGYSLLSFHGSKSDNSRIAHNLAKTNSKLDSIDHKLGKYSPGNTKMPGMKGEKLPGMKGDKVSGMNGKSLNKLNKADHGLSLSRFIKKKIADKRADKEWEENAQAQIVAERQKDNANFSEMEKDYFSSISESSEGSHPELDIDAD